VPSGAPEDKEVEGGSAPKKVGRGGRVAWVLGKLEEVLGSLGAPQCREADELNQGPEDQAEKPERFEQKGECCKKGEEMTALRALIPSRGRSHRGETRRRPNCLKRRARTAMKVGAVFFENRPVRGALLGPAVREKRLPVEGLELIA
jgi:hypothetical protein